MLLLGLMCFVGFKRILLFIDLVRGRKLNYIVKIIVITETAFLINLIVPPFVPPK
jgi:hypothetical protein